MPIDDQLIEELKCNLNKRDHFLNEALALPCGHSCCKNCIVAESGKKFFCKYPGCNEYHKIRFVDDLKPVRNIEDSIKKFDKELKEIIYKKLHDLNEKANEENAINNFNSISNGIEMNIDVRVESLKEDIHNSILLALQDIQMRKEEKLKEINMLKNDAKEHVKEMLSESNTFDLKKFQNQNKKLKTMIQKINNKKRSVNYQISSESINESFVGDITCYKDTMIRSDPIYPKEYEFNNLVSSSERIVLSDPSISCISHFESKGDILVCTKNSSIVTIVDDETFLKTKEIKFEKLQSAKTICVSKDEEIFIADCKARKIFVYDRNFNLLREHDRRQNLLIEDIFSMNIDNTEKHLYISERENHIIRIVECKNCNRVLEEIKFELPSFIKIFDDRLLVISGIFYDDMSGFMPEELRVKKGESAIHILEKRTWASLRKISFKNWLDLRGIWIDDNLNIYTTAFEVQRLSRTVLKFSHNSRTLYKLGKNGEIVEKKCLNINYVADFVFINKHLVCLHEKDPHALLVIEFGVS